MKINGAHKRNLASILQRYITDVKEVARLTGMKERTVRAHMHGQSGPYYDDLCEYIRVLGPEFTTELFAELGYRAVALEGTEEDGCYRSIMKETAEFTYHASQALEDGYVDHREHRFLLKMAKSLKAKLSRAVAVWRMQTQ